MDHDQLTIRRADIFVVASKFAKILSICVLLLEVVLVSPQPHYANQIGTVEAHCITIYEVMLQFQLLFYYVKVGCICMRNAIRWRFLFCPEQLERAISTAGLCS